MKWALLYFASYPETQELIRTEFGKLDEQKFFLTESDLPQTTAILLEIQRLCPVVPLGVPHGTTKGQLISEANFQVFT